jgi:hypothetical protein
MESPFLPARNPEFNDAPLPGQPTYDECIALGQELNWVIDWYFKLPDVNQMSRFNDICNLLSLVAVAFRIRPACWTDFDISGNGVIGWLTHGETEFKRWVWNALKGFTARETRYMEGAYSTLVTRKENQKFVKLGETLDDVTLGTLLGFACPLEEKDWKDFTVKFRYTIYCETFDLIAYRTNLDKCSFTQIRAIELPRYFAFDFLLRKLQLKGHLELVYLE